MLESLCVCHGHEQCCNDGVHEPLGPLPGAGWHSVGGLMDIPGCWKNPQRIFFLRGVGQFVGGSVIASGDRAQPQRTGASFNGTNSSSSQSKPSFSLLDRSSFSYSLSDNGSGVVVNRVALGACASCCDTCSGTTRGLRPSMFTMALCVGIPICGPCKS
jgi:hypothetical protein